MSAPVAFNRGALRRRKLRDADAAPPKDAPPKAKVCKPLSSSAPSSCYWSRAVSQSLTVPHEICSAIKFMSRNALLLNACNEHADGNALYGVYA